MRKNVEIVRMAIDKIVHMLSGMNIEVTQRGDRAFVTHDTRTGRPTRVNIPYLPDGASDELIYSTQGFLDHEVAHVLFTDPAARAKAANDGGELLDSVHNMVEDCFIERMMAKRFKGSGVNLSNVRKMVFQKQVTPSIDALRSNPDATEADWFKRVNIIMMRAMSGHPECQEVMDDGLWEKVPNVTKALHFFERDIQKCKNSWDTLALAQRVIDAVKDLVKEDPPEQEDDSSGQSDGDQCEKPSKGKSQSSQQQSEEGEADDSGDASESEDQSESQESDEEGAQGGADASSDDAEDGDEGSSGSKSKSSGKDDEGEAGEDESEADGDSGDDDVEEDGVGESDNSDDSEEGDDETSGDEASDDDGDDSNSSEGDEDGDDSDGEADGATEQDTGEASAGEVELMLKAFEEMPDFMEMAQAHVSKVYQEDIDDMTYGKWLIFSREYDEPQPFEAAKACTQDSLDKMTRTVDKMIGPMAKHLERLLMAKKRNIFEPGRRSGRLHSAALHRLKANDDRVFRRKHEMRMKNTAVEILTDMSGSMGGHKIEVAAYASYAIAQMLQRVNIASEVMTFSTRDVPGAYAREMQAAEQRIGRMFSHRGACNHYLIKGFNERMSPDVLKRFAHLGAGGGHMWTNCDPESVDVAARRLAYRQEERRVLLVLSDGHPSFAGDRTAGDARLKEVIKNAEGAGMEVVGIGITDDSVRKYYPKCVVIQNVDDLPSAIMGELQRILMK